MPVYLFFFANRPKPMDLLSQILDTVRLKGSLYCRSELSSPWGLHFMRHPCAVFHALYRGEGLLQLTGGGASIHLRAGDVVLLPGGEEHAILEAPDAPIVHNLKLDQWGECALMRWGEQPTAVLLCGTFDFEHPEMLPLLRQLPDVLHIPHCEGSTLGNVLALMAAEAEAERPAKEVALRRLADILFIQMIQRWVEIEGVEQCGWLGALHDPLIEEALRLIHTQPHQPWTVASLARVVACSRSSFAARFRARVGEAPMAYLTRWRMQQAALLLSAQPPPPISEVAAQVGYGSAAAFSRAFKRQLGATPKTQRR